ncbi:PepSY-associated TM region [Flavobacteriaceae bacterium MAR_2010_188]|nr:PepSY-associated TM region [Flavobacteriaceae bacterium MAR_2010_188]
MIANRTNTPRKKSTGMWMRIIHRYLGYFLAGIMLMYSVSGIVLIFRDTDFLKIEKVEESKIKSGLSSEEIGKTIRARNFKIEKEEGNLVYFNSGSYNRSTGELIQTKNELPFVLSKMTKLHKANTNSPLYFLNIFFGVSLLFFVISAFYMFIPKSDIFKKGLIFTAVGVVLTFILIFV